MIPTHDRKLSRRKFCLGCVGAIAWAASGGSFTLPREVGSRA